MKFGNNNFTIGQQISAMLSLFPQFKYRRRNQCPTWRGSLQPTDESPTYTVRIAYPYPFSPRVWIVFPFIDPDAPHRYSDQSLCLYYPQDRSWHGRRFIAETIVPWTAEWLAFYEIWCLTGEWYGDEVLHTGNKSR